MITKHLIMMMAGGLAAQAALAAWATASALMHARQSLAMDTAIDPWADEPAAPWLRAAVVLRAAGAPSEADRKPRMTTGAVQSAPNQTVGNTRNWPGV